MRRKDRSSKHRISMEYRIKAVRYERLMPSEGYTLGIDGYGRDNMASAKGADAFVG